MNCNAGEVTISVFGLGYVGTVTAACLSSERYRIIGVDTQPGKVAAMHAGRSPIVEPEVGSLIARASTEGRLSATVDAEAAVLQSDASIVCVGTPSLATGALDLTYVRHVVGQIADAVRQKATGHVIILRSTMLPGSTRALVREHLQGMVDEGRVEVLFVPEFLREGTAVSDFRDPSLAVVGTEDGSALRPEVAVLVGSVGRGAVSRWEEAEAVKYACNAFHALKVGFANEIGRLCKANGIDGRKVMRTVCDDTRLNISAYYMRPGNPFGGSCLPKDVSALNAWAARSGMSLPVIAATVMSNREQQELLLRQVLADGRKRVAILGLSFKPATDDLRNSPMVYLAESLLGKGYELSIYDPQLNPDRLVGSNESMMAKALPHLNRLMRDTPEEAVGESEVLVVSQPCVAIDVLRACVTSEHHVIDVNSWPDLESLAATYEGLCWDADGMPTDAVAS